MKHVEHRMSQVRKNIGVLFFRILVERTLILPKTCNAGNNSYEQSECLL